MHALQTVVLLLSDLIQLRLDVGQNHSVFVHLLYVGLAVSQVDGVLRAQLAEVVVDLLRVESQNLRQLVVVVAAIGFKFEHVSVVVAGLLAEAKFENRCLACGFLLFVME